MPWTARKGKKKQAYLNKSSDITIQDFADCSMPQACNRVKKSVVKATSSAVIQRVSAEKVLEVTETENLDWFDRDLESFVISDKNYEEEEEIPELDKACLKNHKRVKKKICKDESGITYPPDIWFHLSNFIDPQDVARFASICVDSYAVTRTAAFWRHLYHRSYKETKEKRENLPSHLRPSGMEKLNGLRSRVIAALFHIHQPFVERLHRQGPMEAEPHDLTGYRCLIAWHQPAQRGWQFCFKLQKPSIFRKARSTKLDLDNGYNDIFDNPEDGCCILQVICCHFASVPAVMGLLLKQVYMTLSAGFRHHRLRLHFDSSFSSGSTTSSQCDTVANLDDVIGVKVIHWWHSAYPFSPGTINNLI